MGAVLILIPGVERDRKPKILSGCARSKNGLNWSAGHLDVYSAEGELSRFIIMLPIADQGG